MFFGHLLVGYEMFKIESLQAPSLCLLASRYYFAVADATTPAGSTIRIESKAITKIVSSLNNWAFEVWIGQIVFTFFHSVCCEEQLLYVV